MVCILRNRKSERVRFRPARMGFPDLRTTFFLRSSSLHATGVRRRRKASASGRSGRAHLYRKRPLQSAENAIASDGHRLLPNLNAARQGGRVLARDPDERSHISLQDNWISSKRSVNLVRSPVYAIFSLHRLRITKERICPAPAAALPRTRDKRTIPLIWQGYWRSSAHFRGRRYACLAILCWTNSSPVTYRASPARRLS